MHKYFKELIRSLHSKGKRAAAAILALTMLVGSTDYTGLVALASDREYSNTLNGWKVSSGWGNLSDTYEWNAERAETRSFKMIVTYRVENADHVDKEKYAPGEITFRVPGLGNANRVSVKKASALPSDSNNTEWNCSWDENSDVYTFTNNVEMDAQSINGGFEVMWTLSARDTVDHYEQARSVEFGLDDQFITLPPLHFEFTSVPDVVRIGTYDSVSDSWKLQKSYLSASEYGAQDTETYAWYNIETKGDTDYRARGLYYSNYYITLDLPDGVTSDDVIIQRLDGTTTGLDENNGFYEFSNRRGDILNSRGNAGNYYLDMFKIGLKKSTFDALDANNESTEIVVKGHLDRLYYDDTEWVEDELVAEDNVDAEVTFSYQDYHYDHVHVHVPEEHDYYYSYSRYAEKTTPYRYTDYRYRYLVDNIFKGNILNFSFGGNFGVYLKDAGHDAYDYDQYNLVLDDGAPANAPAGVSRKLALARRTGATASDLVKPTGRLLSIDDVVDADEMSKVEEGFEDWNDIEWADGAHETQDAPEDGKTYGEIREEEDIPDDLTSGSGKSEEKGVVENVVNAAKSLLITDVQADEKATSSEMSDQRRIMKALSNGYVIDKDLTWDLMTGDDKMIVLLNDGTFRDVTTEEYDMVYITLAPSQYPVQVFYTTDPDNVSGYDDYVLAEEFNQVTDTTTVSLPDGAKGVFVKVCGITGSFYYYPKVGVRFHFDVNREAETEYEKRIDRAGYIRNYAYFRMLYQDEVEGEAVTINDMPSNATAYTGTYGPILAERDVNLYGEYPYRIYDNVYLRNPYYEIDTTVDFKRLTGSQKTGFTGVVNATGNIIYRGDGDVSGELHQFSMFTTANENLYTNANANFNVSGTGYDLDGNDYSGPPANLGRSSAQLDRASAHLMQSAVQPMLAAVQHTS